MSTQLLIESLEREIAQEEAALEEKRITVRVLKRRDLQTRVATAAAALTPTAMPPIPARVMPQTERSETFTDLVVRAIGELGGNEFVTNDVYVILLRYGVPLPDDPKSKIPTVFTRLVGKEHLRMTFKGGGNVPNRYQVTGTFPKEVAKG